MLNVECSRGLRQPVEDRPVDPASLASAHAQARAALLASRLPAGHWEGELSTSALSTATAIVALGSVDERAHAGTIERAARWLATHVNSDGGWGDTVKSFSNISTTLLCWSALRRFGGEAGRAAALGAEDWIRGYVGSLSPALIAETVKARYGKDRTFSVPILMLCAICGNLGETGWRQVLRLPFELAAFPRRCFAAMRLPVVSYALPALIAIGYAGHRQGWISRLGRRCCGDAWTHPLWPRVSRLLTGIQPASGGFLEAAPLTSFVTMALVAAGEREHPVARKGVEFLLATVRPDGSWPIDTNLATWSTTLSVKALAAGTGEGAGKSGAVFEGNGQVLEWLLGQQYREVHPFTDSPPGGWAWTDLSGGVPDADDTPGALLALRHLDGRVGGDQEAVAREGEGAAAPPTGFRDSRILEAATAGSRWLLGLQNRDGGMPTFCRGWGALPFDRSSPDLTAHALRAWLAWRDELPRELRRLVSSAVGGGLGYLLQEQRGDGSWAPLWFGNQHRLADEENPTYGTAMVLRAFDALAAVGDLDEKAAAAAAAGRAWLCVHQNEDGGWGAKRGETPSTIEETSLALSALAFHPETAPVLERGARWLLEATRGGREFEAAPIGFYFARLWYYERSYPLVWSCEALGRLCDPRSALRTERSQSGP